MEWEKKIIQAIKEQWIEDFGKLEDTTSEFRDGYFVSGFVESVLDKMGTPAHSGEELSEIERLKVIVEKYYKGYVQCYGYSEKDSITKWEEFKKAFNL